MDKKNISLFKIDVSELPVVATSRQLIIDGDIGSEFNVVIYDSSDKWYDFKTNTFTAGFSTSKNLKVKMAGSKFVRNISFSGGGITYTIFLLTPPDKNTELATGVGGKNVASKTLASVANATVTLALATNSSSNYETLPTSLTSTGNSAVSGSTTLDIDWTVTNKAHNSYAFGLIVASEAVQEAMVWDNNWYFSTTETVDGAVASDENLVVVDDTTDLAVGMELTYITGTTAPGATTSITAIDTTTKTLTLSRNQALTDGHTMTFRAYGSSNIEKAIGLVMDFDQLKAENVEILTTQVLADVSASDEITLRGAYGLAGGGVVSFTGVGVVETNNTVTSLSHSSSSSAAITAAAVQTLAKGATLTFTGSVREIRTTGTATINQYPDSNRTIYLDLDKFITVGAAS